MKPLDRIESWLAQQFGRIAAPVSGPPPPPAVLEIRRDVLNDVRSHIQPKGHDEYFFEHNVIAIRVGAADLKLASVYEAGLIEGETLETDIRNLLKTAGCTPRGLEISIGIDESGSPLTVQYERRKQAVTTVAPSPIRVRLKVLSGKTDQSEYELQAERINLGRMRSVASPTGGLIRRNDVAFDETEVSVAREHAYIRRDRATGKFRLCDYLSGDSATRLFREGRAISVPKGSDHGTQLRTADEIHLGNASVLFEEISGADS
jgi:hypothetical protein